MVKALLRIKAWYGVVMREAIGGRGGDRLAHHWNDQQTDHFCNIVHLIPLNHDQIDVYILITHQPMFVRACGNAFSDLRLSN